MTLLDASQWALSALGLTTCWLLGSKRRTGWPVALASNAAWTAYAAATHQWGLIAAELVYAALNIRGWLAWAPNGASAAQSSSGDLRRSLPADPRPAATATLPDAQEATSR